MSEAKHWDSYTQQMNVFVRRKCNQIRKGDKKPERKKAKSTFSKAKQLKLKAEKTSTIQTKPMTVMVVNVNGKDQENKRPHTYPQTLAQAI